MASFIAFRDLHQVLALARKFVFLVFDGAVLL